MEPTAMSLRVRFSPRLLRGLFPFLLADEPARLERVQALGKLLCAGESQVGIDVDAGGNVGAQDGILDVPFPPRAQGPVEISHAHLIEHDAQGIEIALHAGRRAHLILRRRVKDGSLRMPRRNCPADCREPGHGDSEIRGARDRPAPRCRSRPGPVARPGLHRRSPIPCSRADGS